MISSALWDELHRYIVDIHTRTEEMTVKDDLTEVELILSCMSCLQEESGELAAEVRKWTQMSFSEKKVAAFDENDMYAERADVFIVLLLLAKRLGMNQEQITQALREKMEKNRSRGY